MTESGLRERKKRETRRAIVAAALRLFEAKGYEATTVPEIAAAAGVSRATFFNYFPSKEDVVFADRALRVELLADALAGTAAATPGEAVVQAVEALLAAPSGSLDADGELVAVRARLMATVPELRARAVRDIAELQREWSGLLLAAFPDRLDATDADALTGAVVGAVLAVAGGALSGGEPARPLPELVRRAVAVALGRADLQ
ncbi:TetR/AcrR family transcriptional regulator [Allonocardiopsis opalescens]|uniref:TetR family transcriptional regulator n=1 Tax=Allonocardiopsis opalescens TaxID=1144618 RepID=A0A2T0PXT3_9ACTN|nr:TetR/AcrR family transcriptional regulator [Allonocardiopsis opalescens]PRX96350.1 TetR family transcriptional regulator [Allonocardiopsis opalescens]